MAREWSRRIVAAGMITLVGTALTPAPAAAQDVRLTNADLRTVAASSSLAAQVRTLVSQQAEPAWIAYVEPSNNPRMNACCWNNSWGDGYGNGCCGACQIEPRQEGSANATPSPNAAAPGTTGTASPAGPIKLEGSGQFVTLARIEQQQIERVRTFSADCELDAGGRRVYLLTGVTPAASIAWLESLIPPDPPADASGANTASTGRRSETSRGRDRLSDGAIAAIAMHRDPAADAALDRLVAPSRSRHVREKATFWLASARGAHGLDVMRRLVRDDTDAQIRKKAVFGLSVSKEPGATAALIDAARNSPFTDVRSEAIFWAGQVAGRQVADMITDAIERDPETEVKKRAVFALSQMPKDDGVPRLIEVAKTNKNPVVRKQAMFWLGQSKDPRALDFFESILK